MSDMLTAATRRLNPYDSALEDNLSMYDKLPYQRDSNLCNREALALVSGNVLKYYRCKTSEPYKVKTMDDIITYKIAQVFQDLSEENTESAMDYDEYDDSVAEALTMDHDMPIVQDEDMSNEDMYSSDEIL